MQLGPKGAHNSVVSRGQSLYSASAVTREGLRKLGCPRKTNNREVTANIYPALRSVKCILCYLWYVLPNNNYSNVTYKIAVRQFANYTFTSSLRSYLLSVLPVPVVVITAGVRHDSYLIRESFDEASPTKYNNIIAYVNCTRNRASSYEV